MSMFDAMAEWMTVPLLQARRRHAVQAHRPGACRHRALRRVQDPRRRRHSDLDPERPRMARAGRESARQCRARHRSEIRHQSAARSPIAARPTRTSPRAFARSDVAPLMKKLEAADIAFARVNDTALLSKHPHLAIASITVDAPSGPVSTPAPGADLRPARYARHTAPIPALGRARAAVKVITGRR